MGPAPAGSAPVSVEAELLSGDWLFDSAGIALGPLVRLTGVARPLAAGPGVETALELGGLPIAAAVAPIARFAATEKCPDPTAFLRKDRVITRIIPKTRVTPHLFQSVPLACRPIQELRFAGKPAPVSKIAIPVQACRKLVRRGSPATGRMTKTPVSKKCAGTQSIAPSLTPRKMDAQKTPKTPRPRQGLNYRQAVHA
jgi:hypothetical protein